MNENPSSIAFFVHEYPTWITDEINILRENGIEVQVFSFLEKSIFNNNIINNNINPTFIKPPDKNLYRIIGNLIKSPVSFVELLIIFIFIITKYNYSWKSSITSIPCILEASKKISQNTKFIHAHFANTTGFYTSLIAKILKLPFSVTVHAGGIYWPNPVLKFVLDFATKIISINKYNRDFLSNEKGIKKDKIFVSYLGGIPSQKMKKNNWNKAEFRIGCLSFFIETKGIFDIIDAIYLLIKRNVKISLFLAGTGYLEEKLKEKVKALNISQYVNFKGFIDPMNRNKFFDEIDLFCLPIITGSDNYKEGIPVVLMEAMAYGLPVISTRHSGIPELVIDDYTGMLVDEHSPEQIADKIEIALNNPRFLNNLSKNAYEYVSEKFDMNKNIIQKAKTLCWLNNE